MLAARATKNRGPDPAHGSWHSFGGLAAVSSARGGRRSPVGVAVDRRHRGARVGGAPVKIHCLTSVLAGWSGGRTGAQDATVRSWPPRESTAASSRLSSRPWGSSWGRSWLPFGQSEVGSEPGAWRGILRRWTWRRYRTARYSTCRSTFCRSRFWRTCRRPTSGTSLTSWSPRFPSEERRKQEGDHRSAQLAAGKRPHRTRPSRPEQPRVDDHHEPRARRPRDWDG